ncbi:MAG: phosphoribosylformylglycinamidine synthase subunit PurS [Kiloniellales bacterium]
MKARVHVTLKPAVLDPQGSAIKNALEQLGFSGVGDVRQGKLIEIELNQSDDQAAKAEIEAMCKALLVNEVIETYRLELES